MSYQDSSSFSSNDYTEMNYNETDNSGSYSKEYDSSYLACTEPSTTNVSDIHVKWETIDYGGTPVVDALF